MNNDLISRSALLDFAHNHVGGAVDCNDIARFPAADAEPVRHGRWQFERRGKDAITELPVCSGCGATPKYYVPQNDTGMQVPPYCHECGVKMDAEVRHETFHPEPT